MKITHIALTLALLTPLGGCASREPDQPRPTPASPVATATQANEFGITITELKTSTVTGKDVPEAVKEISVETFTPDGLVTMIAYRWRNSGTETYRIAPQGFADIEGREFAGTNPQLPYSDSGNVPPGSEGSGSAWLPASEAVDVAAVAWSVWDASGTTLGGIVFYKS